jgi:hypothetical protein
MPLRFRGSLRDARPLLVCLSLAFAVIGALAILAVGVSGPADADTGEDSGSNSRSCPKKPGKVRVPRAEARLRGFVGSRIIVG